MRRSGYQLTRYSDDWVVTCSSAAQARAALETASRILQKLGVQLNPHKTRIVNVRRGFEFLGHKIKRGSRPMRLSDGKIKSGIKAGALYARPTEKSIRGFKDQIRQLTCRRAPVSTAELIQQINPVVRGWGEHFKRAHVRSLFHQLDGWIERRIWSHRFKRWRCRGWDALPSKRLYGELGLVNLINLIPSLAYRRPASS
jgi:RNA-directed DNA polymerase